MGGYDRILERASLVALLVLAAVLAPPAPVTATEIFAIVPLGMLPSGMAADPATGLVYVAGSYGRVAVIDGRAGRPHADIVIDGCPARVAIDAGAGLVYITDRCRPWLWVVEARTGRLVTAVAVPAPLWAVAVDARAHRIYAARYDGVGQVVVVDGASGMMLVAIPVDTEPEEVAIDEVTGRVYVTHAVSGALTVLDGRALVVAAVVPDLGLSAPTGLAVAPDGGRVYIGGGERGGWTGAVVAVDGRTHAVTRIAAAGDHIGRVAVDPVDGRLYACDARAGGLTILDSRSDNIVGTIALGQGCRALAVDAAAGRVFVAGSSGTATPDGELVVLNVADAACPAEARLPAPGRDLPPACRA